MKLKKASDQTRCERLKLQILTRIDKPIERARFFQSVLSILNNLDRAVHRMCPIT